MNLNDINTKPYVQMPTSRNAEEKYEKSVEVLKKVKRGLDYIYSKTGREIIPGVSEEINDLLK